MPIKSCQKETLKGLREITPQQKDSERLAARG